MGENYHIRTPLSVQILNVLILGGRGSSKDLCCVFRRIPGFWTGCLKTTAEPMNYDVLRNTRNCLSVLRGCVVLRSTLSVGY